MSWFEMQVISGKVTYGLMSTSDAIDLVNSKLTQSTPTITGWGAAWQGATPSIRGAVTPLQEAVSAEDQFKNSTDLLQAQLQGPVRSAMETHTANVQAIRDRTMELRDKVTELEGKRWLTGEQKQQLADAQTELAGVRGKVEEADAALKREIQTMIISTLMAKSTSADQVAAITAIAQSWGLLDAPTGKAVTGTLAAWDAFTKGKISAAEFKTALDNATASATSFTPNAGEMQHALDAIAASGGKTTTSLGDVKTSVVNVSTTKPNVGEIQHALDAIASSGSNSKSSVDSLIKSLNNIPTQITSTITTIFQEAMGGGRATGGPVFPGQNYRVNEGGLQESMISKRGFEMLHGSTLRPREPGFVIPADRTRALTANPLLGGGRGPAAGPVDMSRQIAVTANIYNQMSQAVFEQRLKAAIG